MLLPENDNPNFIYVLVDVRFNPCIAQLVGWMRGSHAFDNYPTTEYLNQTKLDRKCRIIPRAQLFDMNELLPQPLEI